MSNSRRDVLTALALGTAALPLFAGPAEAKKKAPPAKPAEVNATEDLMREHGVIRRVLIIYRETERRLSTNERFDPAALAQAAQLMRRFGEQYHERLEEEQVFPRLEQAGKLKDLVQVLRTQHAAGRKLTETILANSTREALEEASNRELLAHTLDQFERMYQAHAAHEDTDLFPVFHAMFSEKEFDALGDKFEDEEHRLIGENGFEKALEELGQLERAFGVADLASFTPR